jgi:hypothetical protein
MTVPGFPVRCKSGQKIALIKRSGNEKTARFHYESLRFFIGNQPDIFC